MPSLRSRFPMELGSVSDPEAQLGRLHRLALAGGPGWGLTRLLRRVVQVDGENSAGQTGLFLSALLGHSSAVQLLLTFGANPNHRCLDGSTPVHAGAFSGRSLVMLHLLQAGGDLRLHDQQGRTPWDWAEQGGAKQSWEVLELLELCRAHMSALVHDDELVVSASLGQLQAGCRHSLCGSLSLPWRECADRAPRRERIRRPPRISALGFGQLSCLRPLGLVTGIPLADPKELLPAQGEPDRTYESSSHTLMANLLWRGHSVTARKLKAPEAQPDVLLADLQHCSTLHHPNLLLLMALSPSADLSGLCLLFEPVWLGSLHVVLHPRGPSPGGPRAVPGLLPGHLLLQVLEALLFLQARWHAHGGLSSHAVQLVRPGLAKVSSLEHGRPLHQHWLQPRPQQGYSRGGSGPGLPPPPELYPWLPLELICGDTPAATSDLYSFCILAQEVFTGGHGPGTGYAGRPGSDCGTVGRTHITHSAAFPQDSAPEVSSRMHWTTRCPASQDFLPDTLYCEVAPRTKIPPRPVPPVMSLGLSPCQALKTPEVTGRNRVQRASAWDSDSSLTLGSSPSPGSSLYPDSSPAARVSLHHCLEPSSTEPSTELIRGCLFSSLQKMDLLEEIIAELRGGCPLGDKPSFDPAPEIDS
ncbi:inactive serine/threonine-protein kinase TEX14-like isoform X2 [Mustela putorius furo]|uniref:Inactive serine/threonine-protein kinase TEX14-like isoform X2 n=1 Tax=Mustela putorius furo TaxID=9669 RepID=A0A8U0T0K4_MUSPF|nr:inactive serine/threonine-protein kinase TEX14-like isoform X2 [Mustela putorius furo]